MHKVDKEVSSQFDTEENNRVKKYGLRFREVKFGRRKREDIEIHTRKRGTNFSFYYFANLCKICFGFRLPLITLRNRWKYSINHLLAEHRLERFRKMLILKVFQRQILPRILTPVKKWRSE